MERVEVSRFMVGICAMQVCAVADATDKEMLEVANTKNPAGTSAGWTQVCRQASSELMENAAPSPCEDFPGRIHYLIFC